MEYKARKFNENTYKKYDNFAKEKIIAYLKKRGHIILNKEENYNHLKSSMTQSDTQLDGYSPCEILPKQVRDRLSDF